MNTSNATIVLLCVALVTVIVTLGIPRKKESIVYHIDKEHNVLCYTWRDSLQCFAYVDQGTHLEIVSPAPALAL